MLTVTMLPPAAVLAADFEGLALGFRSLREPIKESIQKVFAPSIRQNFSVGGRPSWEPLADSTVEKKGHDTILVDGGTLKRVAGQLNIWHIDGGYGSGHAEAYVSSLPGAEYGMFHQEGTDHVPQREFLLFQDEDVRKAEDIFQRFITKRLAMAGF